MASPLRLGIFGALSEARGKQRARQQEQAALQQAAEDRRMAMEDRTRRQSLEDMLRQRQNEEYEYERSQRPLEEMLKQAQIQATRAQATQRLGQGQPKQRPIPASAVEKEISVDNLRSSAGNVQRSLESAIANKVDATGRVGGVLPTPSWWKNANLPLPGMGTKGGEEGRQVRNIINSLKATVAKERAGTALSPAELDLLESYIPNDNDDEAQALQKAKDFIAGLDQIKANRQKAFAKYGYGEGVQEDSIDQLPYTEY